jgi:hypothetical protein
MYLKLKFKFVNKLYLKYFLIMKYNDIIYFKICLITRN